MLTLPTAGEGESALSVSAFYGWLDCVMIKRLVETVGLDPEGEDGTFPFTLYRQA